jgi:hypothetical protein
MANIISLRQGEWGGFGRGGRDEIFLNHGDLTKAAKTEDEYWSNYTPPKAYV